MYFESEFLLREVCFIKFIHLRPSYIYFIIFWNIGRPIWVSSSVTKNVKIVFWLKMVIFWTLYRTVRFEASLYIFFIFGTLVILLLVFFLFWIFLNFILNQISLFWDRVYKIYHWRHPYFLVFDFGNFRGLSLCHCWFWKFQNFILNYNSLFREVFL